MRPSLKARAIALLAQREQSRMELRRKLIAAARREAGEEADDCGADAGAEASEIEAQVDSLLDWLEAQGHLSASRFVESRVHARESRFGTERIRRELAQHGLGLPESARQQLQATEYERARAVWSRKFGASAADAAGQARQARFLVARGFSSEVVRRLLKALPGDEEAG